MAGVTYHRPVATLAARSNACHREEEGWEIDGDTVIFRTKTQTYTSSREKDFLGKGTYGSVLKAKNRDQAVAAKAFQKIGDRGGLDQTTLREINTMRLMDHPNVVKIYEVAIPSDMKRIFYTMELCKGSVYDKKASMAATYLSKPEFTGDQLPVEYRREAKFIIWQMLNGLAYVHSWGVSHRDLKPANVLWAFDNTVKIGDFGLAKVMHQETTPVGTDCFLTHTGEVQTQWYRAPEILLGGDTYGINVDDWSVGCMMAELFNLKACPSNGRTHAWKALPFFNGDNAMDTLVLILETVGTPKKESEDYKAMSRLRYWSSSLPSFRAPDTIKESLQAKLPLLDLSGIDLLAQLLRLNPAKRTPARFLLDHHWFDEIREKKKNIKAWNDTLKSSNLYAKLKDVRDSEPAQKLNAREPIARADANTGGYGASQRVETHQHQEPIMSKSGSTKAHSEANTACCGAVQRTESQQHLEPVMNKPAQTQGTTACTENGGANPCRRKVEIKHSEARHETHGAVRRQGGSHTNRKRTSRDNVSRDPKDAKIKRHCPPDVSDWPARPKDSGS